MKKLLQYLGDNRCAILFFALLLHLVVYPFVPESGPGGSVYNIFGTFIVFSAVYAAAEHRRHIVVAVTLAAFALVTSWADQFTDGNGLNILSGVTDVVLQVYIAAILLHFVLGRGAVTSEKLFAAICVYILIGLFWGRLYFTIDEFVQPGSFVMNISTGEELDNIDVFNYFSFVTLTTLGYGDIVPVTPVARALAKVEAVVGVLFLAVLISRLASKFRAQADFIEDEDV